MSICRSFLVILLLFVSGSALTQDLQTLGQDIPTLIKECESCHGPNGNSTEADIPSLAGKSVQYIQKAIDQFYFYERHCPTTTYRHGEHEESPPMNMCSIANGLSDEEILALAQHFEAQSPGNGN